jgi:hypothetical protein
MAFKIWKMEIITNTSMIDVVPSALLDLDSAFEEAMQQSDLRFPASRVDAG